MLPHPLQQPSFESYRVGDDDDKILSAQLTLGNWFFEFSLNAVDGFSGRVFCK